MYAFLALLGYVCSKRYSAKDTSLPEAVCFAFSETVDQRNKSIHVSIFILLKLWLCHNGHNSDERPEDVRRLANVNTGENEDEVAYLLIQAVRSRRGAARNAEVQAKKTLSFLDYSLISL